MDTEKCPWTQGYSFDLVDIRRNMNETFLLTSMVKRPFYKDLALCLH